MASKKKLNPYSKEAEDIAIREMRADAKRAEDIWECVYKMKAIDLEDKRSQFDRGYEMYYNKQSKEHQKKLPKPKLEFDSILKPERKTRVNKTVEPLSMPEVTTEDLYITHLRSNSSNKMKQREERLKRWNKTPS